MSPNFYKPKTSIAFLLFFSDYIPPSAYNDGYSSSAANDFDSLLQKARAGLKKK